jgi:phenylacetate-CoA ligase
MTAASRGYAPRPHLRTWRGILYAGLQGLRGFPFDRYARELEATEALPTEEFERRIAARLAGALEFARAEVPLYQDGAWAGMQAAPDAGLAAWPLLERSVVRGRIDELRPRDRGRRRAVTHSTSGSTGKLLKIRLSPDAEAWGWAHRYRALLWHGLPIGVPALRLSHKPRPLRDFLLHQRCVQSLDDARAVDAAIAYLATGRARLVAGSPSKLFYLARCLRERGYDAPLAPFARVGGEQLFGFQREAIERHLCARALDSYGCTEMGAVAGECEAGSLHVYSNHVHVEIFDRGAPAPPGTFGDIVLTSLRNRAMPLVRYRVGDRARLLPGRCRCGLPQPVLADLQARAADAFTGSDGARHHASELVTRLSAVYASREADGIRQVQFEQLEPQAWRVWAEKPDESALAPALEERLARLVRDVAGEGCRVELRVARVLPREHGKFRYYRLRPAP